MATDMRLATTIFRDMSEGTLHPKAYDQFRRLAYALEADHRHGKIRTLFKPFETFRHPARQFDLYNKVPKVTNARQYESAHQFGLAVDFVAMDNDRWSWLDSHDWDGLKQRAEAVGLLCPIQWDRPHVEHPLWQDYRACLRSL